MLVLLLNYQGTTEFFFELARVFNAKSDQIKLDPNREAFNGLQMPGLCKQRCISCIVLR